MAKRPRFEETFLTHIDELNALVRTDISLVVHDRKRKKESDDDDYMGYAYYERSLRGEESEDVMAAIYAELNQNPLDISEKKRLYDLLDEDILEYLIYAYTDGAKGAAEMLGEKAQDDETEMYEAVYGKTKGKTWEERLRDHIDAGSLNELSRLTDTEMHRVINTGIENSGRKLGAKYKEWHTMLDDRVRDTHEYLEGMRIPFEERFITIDGDEAMRPGGFELPYNNINCRCYIKLYKEEEER